MSVDQSFEEETNNTLQLSEGNTKPCVHIEDLSNEIFYEIFEYIDCYDLLHAFSNLNSRFQILLNYPFLSLKMHVNAGSKSEIQKYCTQFLTPNKQRIVSLHANDCLCIDTSSSPHIIDSSFNRLQSLILNRVRHNQFISLLPILTSLPHLSTITVHFNDSIVNLTEIYRLLFLLSSLKNLQLSAKGYSLTMSLPLNKTDPYSRIERMTIKHPCNLTELITLLSYTPLLVRLTCMELTKQDEFIPKINALKMIKNLTHMTMGMCNVQFDQLKIFIRDICQQLRVLFITTSQDVTYLDASRWEKLICQYMPCLRVFQFGYDEYHYQTIELTSHHILLNQFTSSFWIDRGWFFQITMDIDYWPPIKMTYAICPHSQSSCQIFEDNTNIKLTIDRLYFAVSRESLVDEIFSFIQTLQITHLIVDGKKFVYMKFLQLLRLLPNLNSLGIVSLLYFKLKCSSAQETNCMQSWLDTNQITRLEIQSFIEESDLEKIQFFIELCGQMKYLQVKCEHTSNVDLIVRYILLKNMNKCTSFNVFCLWVPITSDAMVKQLQEIIHQEKLLIWNYKMTRTSERIYLQWNLE